jgi:hypothetical protein
MIIEFGTTLASSTLLNYRPVVGVPSVVSLLDLDRVVAHEAYWIPKSINTDIFGPIICDSGLARKAFGEPTQYYSMPIFVHNSMVDPNGQLMVWKMTKSLYNSLANLMKTGDLSYFSIQVLASKQGQGTRTEFSIIPVPPNGYPIRAYWTEEFKNQIKASVDFWFECADNSLFARVSENELIELLASNGFDFQNNCFPNALAQSSSYFSAKQLGQNPHQQQPALQMHQPVVNQAYNPQIQPNPSLPNNTAFNSGTTLQDNQPVPTPQITKIGGPGGYQPPVTPQPQPPVQPVIQQPPAQPVIQQPPVQPVIQQPPAQPVIQQPVPPQNTQHPEPPVNNVIQQNQVTELSADQIDSLFDN